MKSIKLSTYVLITITAFALYFALRFKKRIEWDVREYYLYLPATFIHHDPGFNFIESLPESEKSEYKNWVGPSPSGKIVSRMTMGMAIAYTPFFAIGHLFAKILHEPQTGFSSPYQTAMNFCGLFYGILGLFFLRKVLRRYFPERITALTLLCIGLGTNLFYYMAVEGSMSHVVSFCLFSIFLWYTIKWHEQQRWKYIIFLALSLGLVSLVRPTNLMLCIIFILYGITNLESIKAKIKLLLSHYWQILALLAIMFLVALPQLLYWHAQTGHYVYYSYGKQRFFFDRPRIWKGFFSYRKGWFVYTPVMLLAVFGFFRLKRNTPTLLLPILVFTFINIYVLLSWWCWWYGGGFGMRAFIESYVFLSLPMAAFFTWVSKQWKALMAATLLFAFATVYLNLFQTFQYANGWLHWDSMSKGFYWATFNKKGWLPEDISKKLQDPPDYDAAMVGKSEERGK